MGKKEKDTSDVGPPDSTRDQMWGKLYDRQGKPIAVCRKEDELYHFYDLDGKLLFRTGNITVKLATVLVENRRLTYIQ